jgi:hypothetical protein
MMTKTTIALSLAVAMAAVVPSAKAAPWPASVLGTWQVRANQSHLTLKILTQAATGVCPVISGTLQDLASPIVNNVEGFYCPGSGRISFLRKDKITNDTFQNWTGNLSDPGANVVIGGTFTSPSFNSGEYGFFTVK